MSKACQDNRLFGGVGSGVCIDLDHGTPWSPHLGLGCGRIAFDPVSVETALIQQERLVPVLDEPHDLISELPEYGERIRALQQKDSEFRRLLADYDALDGEIQDIELAGTPIDDWHAEAMKKRRLALKDELFQRLQSPPA